MWETVHWDDKMFTVIVSPTESPCPKLKSKFYPDKMSAVNIYLNDFSSQEMAMTEESKAS